MVGNHNDAISRYFSTLNNRFNISKLMEQKDLLIILKVLFMLGFVAIVLIVGTLPLRVKRFRKNKFLRSMGTTFAGALFVNVAILHILPQAADTLQEHFRDVTGDDEVFPLANLLLMVGFLITIFFTRIIATHSHDHEHFDDSSSISSEIQVMPQEKVTFTDKKGVPFNINQTLEPKNQVEEDEKGENEEPLLGEIDLEKELQPEPDAEQEPVQEEPPNHQDTYFLTLAMYFHTIFEGIAIGVQNTTGSFLSIAVAIAFHKWADALSMGIQYRNRNVPTKIAYGLIAGQAILNAVAIGLGWIIDSFGEVTQAVFLSISAGTFLAISTMEMLGEQLHRHSYRPQKFVIMVFATGFISAVWFFENKLFNNEEEG